jgi:hypothetical protein
MHHLDRSRIVMKQLAIVSRAEKDIERKLSDCVEHLGNTGVWVYATHRGRGYAVIWADDHLLDVATQQLRDAGFDIAPLTYNRSPQIRTAPPPAIVSNQNGKKPASNLVLHDLSYEKEE